MTIRWMLLTVLFGCAATGAPALAVDGAREDVATEGIRAPDGAAAEEVSAEEAPAVEKASGAEFSASPDASVASPSDAEGKHSMAAARAPRWGFNTSLGFGGTGGDFGKLLQDPVAGDFSIFQSRGRWRFGFGLSFSSFKMKEPYQDEPEWGFQQTYLSATRMLRSDGVVRPYLQLRGGLARLHPRSHIFDFSPPPEEVGDSTTTPANGWSVGLVPGVEIQLNRSLALDLSGYFNWFIVSPEYDLSPVHSPNSASGTAWEARIGLRWHPDDGWPSGPTREPDAPDRPRDAWGVSKNLGWAVAEDLSLNWVASGINEYVRNANFNQISPRSWWYNLDHGLTYDDNEFKTNQYLHPWNGANYFNTGRSNGFGFWESSLFSLGGAFFWECCGETHPMSFNDLVSTGIGGMAVGEEMYRVSGQILNNQSGGVGRVVKEIGALVVDPVRGFNRIVSGRFTAQHANPEQPEDWRGSHAGYFVFAGARVIGEGESLSENTKTFGFFGVQHTFGNVFDNARRKPFDSLAADYQFSPGEEKGLRTVLRIRGDLFSGAFGHDADPTYAWAIVQHFDYHNNQAYEFGQQAFGPSLFARYRLSDSIGLNIRWDGWASILAAVNADYSFVADVAERERYREYDYGPGLGTGIEVSLNRGRNRILSLAYRFQWIHVSNGSIFNKGDEFDRPGGGTVTALGSDATHYLQALGGKAFIPLYKRTIGLGGEAFVLLRKSYYSSPLLRDRDQRNPEARVYVAIDLGH